LRGLSNIKNLTTWNCALSRAEIETSGCAPEAIKKESPVSSDMPGRNKTVLLVEDKNIVRELAIKILNRLRYKVLHASDGPQAIALAKEFKNPIQLLIADVVMPGMNRRELADQLIRIHPEMKILYTSGYTENAITLHGVIDESKFLGQTVLFPQSGKDYTQDSGRMMGRSFYRPVIQRAELQPWCACELNRRRIDGSPQSTTLIVPGSRKKRPAERRGIFKAAAIKALIGPT
jgi:CheY-like chemotaxis protein